MIMFNTILNRTNNLSNIMYMSMRTIVALVLVWMRHLRIVISTIVSNLMECSSMSAPIYASWALTDIFTWSVLRNATILSLYLWTRYCH